MKYLDSVGLTYLWNKISSLFATKAEMDDLLDTKASTSDLADVATTGSYTDLVDAPQYIICTLAEYNSMASHDAGTYYIIIAENNA